MSSFKFRARAASLIVPCIVGVPLALSQGPSSSATNSTSAEPEETIVLNPFLVTGQASSRYQVNDTASGGRISQNIMDSSSTISTLTRQMIDDVGAGLTLQVSRYVPGITDSTIPNALDRITIRGFQTDGQRIDGFTYEGQAAYDQATVERIEVVKGPNALLQPSGTPGGTINLVSKSPKFKQEGYLTVQTGQYDANRVEADVTGPINDKLAYRIVSAYQDSRGYVDRSFRDSLIVSPSLTWRISSTSQLTVHAEYYNFRVNSFDGVPVDYNRTGTLTDFYPAPNVPLDYSIAMPSEYRKERREAAWFLFTGTITEHLSLRLSGRASQVSGPTNGWGYGPATAGGAVNPLNGLWTPGFVYGNAASGFAPSPATPVTDTTLWTHTGTYQTNIYRREDLQNDYVYQYDFPFAKTTTLAGVAYGYYSNNRVSRNGSAPSVTNPYSVGFNYNTDPSTIVWAPINTDQQLRYSQWQKYITESASLLNDKIILNGGVANFSFNGYIVNKIGTGTPLTPGSGDINTVNYGVVVKPIANISFYAGHTENAAPTTSFNTVAAAGSTVPKFSVGKDDEQGVKIQLMNQRLFIMIDHYEISQSAFGIGNPGNLTSPPPPVLLPTLYSTRQARGWEYQLTGSLTKQLSLSANWTHFKNRDPNNIPFRTSAEHSGGIYARYEFTDGTLKGFAVGVGVNYMSKAPGNSASGYTAASTPTTPIPIQPQFYYPAHTVADLNLSYQRGKLTYRLNAFNITDETYWNGGGAQNINNVANPRNITGSVTYKF